MDINDLNNQSNDPEPIIVCKLGTCVSIKYCKLISGVRAARRSSSEMELQIELI